MGKSNLFIHWCTNHRWATFLFVLILLFFILNIIAYRQVYTMTHYRKGNERTESPETITGIKKVKAIVWGVEIPKPKNNKTPIDIGMNYSTETVISRDGIKLEIWIIPNQGNKKIILMFHGYACSKESLLNEAKVFYEKGYTPILVDFRGSGGSGGRETTIGVKEAWDVKSIYDYVNKRYSPNTILLYGKSLGSVAIMRACAVEGVHPDGLILECPFNRMLSTVKNRFESMGLPSFPSVELMVFWGSVEYRFNGFCHNPEEYAKGITCHVLLMQGGLDKRVKVNQAKRIYDNFPGKKSMSIFENSGHEDYLLREPKKWKKEVNHYLEAIEGKANITN